MIVYAPLLLRYFHSQSVSAWKSSCLGRTKINVSKSERNVKIVSSMLIKLFIQKV